MKFGLPVAMLALAAVTPALAADLKSCAKIDAADARLACYDQLAGRQQPLAAPAPAAAVSSNAPIAAPVPAPMPAPAAVATTSATSAATPEQFGSEQLRSTQTAKMQEPQAMQAHIVGTFEGWAPKTRFKLDNGQTWVVIDDRSSYVAATQNQAVTIEKGMFGAYYLSIDGLNSKAKVKRVQ